MDFQDIIYEKKDRIAFITINRPQVLNALSFITVRELHAALVDFDEDPEVWTLIMTGTGDRAFSSGADLKWQDAHPEEAQRYQEQRKMQRRKVYWHLQSHTGGDLPKEIWKPIIAAVNGYCLGGGLETAIQCDMIIASENASFGFPEVTHGWPPGAGGPFFATRNLPLKVAMEMLMIGDRISAQRAYELGLVNKVVPLDKLMETAIAYANRLNENPPLGVRAAKQLALRGLDMPLNYAPLAWHLFADSVTRQVHESEDRIEGRRAFAEKRKPVFKGR